MIKTLVSADLHLGSNPRDSYRDDVFQRIETIMVKHKAERLLLLGDLTEEKDRHSADLVNWVFEQLYDLSQKYQVFVLRGNHDGFDPTLPFFAFIGKLPNVKWINQPKSIQLDGLGKCLFLPHTHNHKKDWKDVKLDKADWIFCHNSFEGAQSESGSILKGIKTDVFPPWAKVISGDIHVPQVIDCVTYVGAPHTIDFGDKYKPRVLLLEGDTKTSISIPGPQKVVLTLKSGDMSEDQPVHKGDVLKIIIKLKADDYAHWPQIQKDYREWGEGLGCKVAEVTYEKVSNTLKLSATSSVRSSRVNDKALMKVYGERRKLSRARLRTGLWLMEKK